MAAAVIDAEAAIDSAVAAHDGVRPVEQGEGDSFVVAFARASDAAANSGSHPEAARVFGAVAAIRHRLGVVRFKVLDASCEAAIATVRSAMGEANFDAAW